MFYIGAHSLGRMINYQHWEVLEEFPGVLIDNINEVQKWMTSEEHQEFIYQDISLLKKDSLEVRKVK